MFYHFISSITIVLCNMVEDSTRNWLHTASRNGMLRAFVLALEVVTRVTFTSSLLYPAGRKYMNALIRSSSLRCHPNLKSF